MTTSASTPTPVQANSANAVPSKSKTTSLKTIMIFITVCMVLTAVYMTFIIKAVPKTVSNSKAGLFAELVDDLLLTYETGKGLTPTTDYAALNTTLKAKFKESPWGLRGSPAWQLDAWSDASVHQRPFLLARYHDAQGRILLLGFIPISKRNFPRTGGFSYKDAWFFTFGRDYNGTQAEAAFPAHQVAVHLEEVEKIEKKGLNLVATNYGNDFYILMLSTADSKQLGRDLFVMSSIYETAP
ncbi:MAG: hypothetical protein H7249_01675 [Chitinophagaceae bacterium]|nr:hypothetical protein [Oligoflexus sp.]